MRNLNAYQRAEFPDGGASTDDGDEPPPADAIRNAIELLETGSWTPRQQGLIVPVLQQLRALNAAPELAADMLDLTPVGPGRTINDWQADRSFCSQCGQDWDRPACGPTHAAVYASKETP